MGQKETEPDVLQRDSGPKERKVENLRVGNRTKRATQTASERQATLQWKSTRNKGNEPS